MQISKWHAILLNAKTVHFGNIFPKNTIRDGGSTALYAAHTLETVYTVDTIDMVYPVDMVYTVRMVYAVDLVYTAADMWTRVEEEAEGAERDEVDAGYE